MGISKGLWFAMILVLPAAPAWGQTVQVRDAVGGENAAGEPGWFYLTGTGSFVGGTLDGDFFRDLHSGTLDLEADFGSGFVEFLTYCMEADVQIALGINTDNNAVGLPHELAPLSSFPGFTAADETALEILWANALADSQTSRVKAAAFQMLTWELVRDDSVDLTGGNFFINQADPHTADVLAQANLWYANIESGMWTDRTELFLLTHPDSQDFLTPIPEPAAISLLLIGAMALVLRRGSGDRVGRR